MKRLHDLGFSGELRTFNKMMELGQASPEGLQSRFTILFTGIEILEAFVDLPDVRKASGKRHHMALCLALFTLAVTAGNRGFLAIGDWLQCYRSELIALFKPPQQRLPSYSTIRRVLLKLDYGQYSAALARFFGIEPLPGETLAVDGRSYEGRINSRPTILTLPLTPPLCWLVPIWLSGV